MRILVKESEALLADLSFEEEQITIGSSASCHIHLADEHISPRNALIAPAGEPGAWYVENLDYACPLLVNDRAISDRVNLQNGDEIVLREFVLKILLGQELDENVVEVEEPQLSPEELAKIKEFPLPPGSVVKRFYEPISLAKPQLDRCARMGVELAECRDVHQLVDRTLGVLLDLFNARVAWLGIRRRPEGELEVIQGKLPSGQSYGTTPLVDLLLYRCLERRQHVCIRKVRDQEQIGSALAVPLVAPGGVLGMVYVDRRKGTRRFQIPDLDVLTVLATQIAAKFESLMKQQVQRSAAVSATEVSVVHSIQAMLDPKSAPVWKNLLLSAYSRSGQENPGDLYDLMKHPDSEITAFMLGHVNGSGAALALSMARLHAIFRVGFLHKDQPHALARALNWLMYDEKDASAVDAIFLLVDPPTGRIQYCRAGKIGAFIIEARGEPRPLEGAQNPAIGQVRSHPYWSKADKIEPGETLALYTRGVATATNVEGQRFGENRFIELLCDGFCQPPATTIQDVTHELTTFFADGAHPDDISIVLLHRPQG